MRNEHFILRPLSCILIYSTQNLKLGIDKELYRAYNRNIKERCRQRIQLEILGLKMKPSIPIRLAVSASYT